MLRQTPELLLIVRERLKPGAEVAYDSLERQVAAVCTQAGCPNPYLAVESRAPPKEVWWLNFFFSEAHRVRVEHAYRENPVLIDALFEVSRTKADLVVPLADVLTKYRADLSENVARFVAGMRFFAVRVATEALPPDRRGATFESPSGEFFTFAPAVTISEANALSAEQAAGWSVVLAIQPHWSVPARDWIAADPDFWAGSVPPHTTLNTPR